MSAKETAFRLAALTALRDLIDTEVKTIRTDLGPELVAHYDETGGDRINITMPGDRTKLANVTLDVKADEPEDTISIDPKKFIVWVEQNAPDEIVPTVRGSYAKVISDRLVIDDAGVVDPYLGLVVDYATVIPAGPAPEPTGKFTLRFEGGTNGLGRTEFAAAWRDGLLTQYADVLTGRTQLALEAGESA